MLTVSIFINRFVVAVAVVMCNVKLGCIAVVGRLLKLVATHVPLTYANTFVPTSTHANLWKTSLFGTTPVSFSVKVPPPLEVENLHVFGVNVGS